MTGAKIENLQALRGIAVLLVLLAHVSDLEKKYGFGGGVLPDFENEGAGGVYLFFVISGFIMVTITQGLHRVRGAWRDFLYRRAARIYPLYWLISLVILGVWLVRPGWVNSSMDGHVDLVASFLLIPQEWMPLLGQGWTLIYEVYFYLAFAFALLMPRHWLPRYLGVWAGAVLLGALATQPLPSVPPVIHVVFNPLALQFLAGCTSALLIARTGPRVGAWCLFGGGVLLALYLASPPSGKPPPGVLILRTLPIVAIVHGAVAMELGGAPLFPRFLRKIGDASYSLYLSHILVISAIGRAWKSFGWQDPFANWILIVVMIAAAIAGGFACYTFLERPLLRLTRRTTGTKETASPGAWGWGWEKGDW